MKVALVYDRINKWGGAERVLLELHKVFPKAAVFTSVYDAKNARWANVFPNIHTTFLQKLPLVKSHHEYFPYLMPIAFESLHTDGFDIVISVTSEYAKAVITKPQALHICYCLTPTRYLWSDKDLYLNSVGSGIMLRIFKIIAAPVISALRIYDQIAAERPDCYIAISKTVSDRINKYYRRFSKVIYPPVDTVLFRPSAGNDTAGEKEKYFLIVSRLVRYKRIDIAVSAFNKLGWQLKIAGAGSDENRLRKMSGRNIEFIGKLTEEKLVGYYQNCEALIFCNEEDFGLTSIEAQACGRPVVAYEKGGVSETVIDGKTGIFYKEQNPQSLMKALLRLKETAIKPDECRRNALTYNSVNFRKLFKKEIVELWKRKQTQTGMV